MTTRMLSCVNEIFSGIREEDNWEKAIRGSEFWILTRNRTNLLYIYSFPNFYDIYRSRSFWISLPQSSGPPLPPHLSKYSYVLRWLFRRSIKLQFILHTCICWGSFSNEKSLYFLWKIWNICTMVPVSLASGYLIFGT